MSTPKERAEEYLTYYFGLIARKAGISWNSDNDQEIGSIVDAIAEMIRDAGREHVMNSPHQYLDGGAP